MDEHQSALHSAPIEPPRRRSKKKIIWASAAVIILLALAACLAISIKVGLTLTQPAKKPIALSPSEYGIEYKDIQFMSRDKETGLSGWVLEPKEEAKMNLIFAHGYKGNRYEENIPFLPLAKQLTDRGYRIVLFDFRYAGNSEGEMTTVGAMEKYDLLGAVDWVKGEYKEPIGLYGISMGASTSILAASQTEDVIAVAADSPFSDLRDYLEENMPVWTDLPNFPFTPLILATIPVITDLDPAEASPINEISKVSPRPILFIHNKGDGAIPYTESEKMAKVDKQAFSLWLTEGKGHVKSYEQNKEEYVERVDAFFDKALLGQKEKKS